MGHLSRKYITFFKELAANNNRDWFHANKKRYEEDVKKPFHNLVQDVITRMQKLDPEIQVEPKDCIFRINRDIRFSKDKTPYKLFMSAAVGVDGRKHTGKPGVYWHAGPEGLSIAGGMYQPDKDNLYKIRAAIAKDPKAFNRILNGKKFKETFQSMDGDGYEKNKIIPKEFREAGEIAPVIYNKSFHYWADYKAQKHVIRDDLAKFLVDHYKIAKKWNEFLIEAVK